MHPGEDWFVIDMEHSPNELADVLLQLQASSKCVSFVKGRASLPRPHSKVMPNLLYVCHGRSLWSSSGYRNRNWKGSLDLCRP